MKKTYRFGWDYFGTRQIRFIKTGISGGSSGMTYMKGIIRDSHQTWDVQSLYPVYLRSPQAQRIARTLSVQSPQSAPSSETQDSTPSSETDARAGREAAEGVGE